MRIDRNAAAVVAHHDAAVGVELELDAAGMAGHRLVHGVVEHLGGEMVKRALVGAADIHAGAAAHRLQPLQDLDVLGGIAARLGLAGEIVEQIGHGSVTSISCDTEPANHNIRWAQLQEAIK